MIPEELFDNNKRLVYHTYSRHFNSAKNLPYKEDILQEGLFRLWKACKLYNPEKNIQFSTFAVTLIYNGMLEFVSRKLEKHTNNISLEEIITVNKDGKPCSLQNKLTIKDDYNDIELRIILRDCFEKLSKEDQKIVLLFWQGYTQREIAVRVGLTQVSVSRRLKKFINKVRKELEDD